MFSKSSGNPSVPEGNPKKTTHINTPVQQRGPSVPSLLSSDLIITGDMKTDGELQIDGRLDGNLTAGKVTIGEHGAVNGKIICTTVLIRGKVTGKIEANTIELTETANVQADLVQDKLVVANGAFFDGKCSRKTTPPTPITAAPKAAVDKKSA